jgi:hypothetical protein
VVEGYTLTYNLPPATDPESTSCTIALVSGPPFASLSGTTMTFNPASGSAGTYLVTLSISDGVNTPQFSFNVIVSLNTPATFLSTPVSQSTPAGVPISYTLPGTSDAESNNVIIGLTAGGPNFVTFVSPNILDISPGLLDVGSYTV